MINEYHIQISHDYSELCNRYYSRQSSRYYCRCHSKSYSIGVAVVVEYRNKVYVHELRNHSGENLTAN